MHQALLRSDDWVAYQLGASGTSWQCTCGYDGDPARRGAQSSRLIHQVLIQGIAALEELNTKTQELVSRIDSEAENLVSQFDRERCVESTRESDRPIREPSTWRLRLLSRTRFVR